MLRTVFVLLSITVVSLIPAGGRAAPELHRVQRGETLHRISRRHGVTVDQLRTWNDLRDNLIYPGQTLVVSTPTAAPHPPAPASDTAYVEVQVRRGETLASIALRHDVSVALLRRLNGISGSRIYAGQTLKVRPRTTDGGSAASASSRASGDRSGAIYEVKAGDTLSEIAQRHGTTTRALQRINGLKGTRIHPGQKLRLKTGAAAAQPSLATHAVVRGETLSQIARRYGMRVGELSRLNGLTSDRIYPGQRLEVAESSHSRTRTYVVRRGDSLSLIAQRCGMTLADLRRVNGLKGSVIHPGQKLTVVESLEPAGGWIELSEIDWGGLAAAPAGVPTIVVENGPYFFRGPRAGEQRSRSYFEGSPERPLATYRRASKLWKEFEAKVDRMGRLSRHLEGWHIVLDPGHGGQDPGTIVKSRDGNGNPVYVVEDEYVYDIALRTYVLLRLHGADVTMTVLSPNHLIRRSEKPTRTFVHEKNEVYNNYAHNRSNSSMAWPRGRYRGLKPRVEIAREALRSAPPHQTIFLSLHADNSPRSPIAPSVLYYSGSGRDDRRSRRFAERLRPALGAGTITRGRKLAVLKDNPADVKVLVEIRNLAYKDNVWALRVEALRQRDAEKLVAGILDHAGATTVVAR